ncbi:Arc family DNA-binding protein [Parabacteroides bouchesdurhonensis]|uniref:Arc family DNA-binding protein n=1 Tax=Parabacteroides bouchesdurhonensis TaxID=1936995 RepID=UPI000C84AAA0|nr:Arc family DNA-binding protein [Parabacteroides bouchesdurhonensis]
MAKKENGNATKNFILRIDAEMMEAIEAWAADEFRSTNGQIQYILDQALRKAGRLKKKRKSESGEGNKE